LIEISSHTETPHIKGADETQVPEGAGKKGMFGSREKSGTSALGVFAKILAGLSVKTGLKNREAGPENTRMIVPDETGETGKYEGTGIFLPGLKGGKNAAKKAVPKDAGIAPGDTAAAGNAPAAPQKITDNRLDEGREAFLVEGFPERLFSREFPAGKKDRIAAEGGDIPPDAVSRFPSDSPGTDAASTPGTAVPRAAVPEAAVPEAAGAEFSGEQAPAAGAGHTDVFEKTGDEPGVDFSSPVFAAGDETVPEKQAGSPHENRGSGAAGARGKKRERFALAAVTVEDLRTAPGDAGREAVFSPETGSGGGLRAAASFHEAEMTVDLHSREMPPGEKGGAPAGSTGMFENLLARELEENLSAGIVREARFILRGGGEGTIRLSLKPESLGNVKIRLEMAENRITGHIAVESEEALRAFEREIHSLEQAFLESGFDGAELDFSLTQGGGNGEERQEPFFREWRGALPEEAFRYDAGQEDAEFFADGIFRRNGRIQVNILI
jgi:hypothetical protein